MTVSEIESGIVGLSRAEKASLLQRLAQDISNVWPGIDKNEGVVGGDATIVRTRIPIWNLVNYRRLGWTEAKILDNYPSLRAIDLVNAWAYADAHKEEIDAVIAENETA